MLTGIQLSSGRITYDSNDKTSIDISLSLGDLLEIKSSTTIAISDATTFLRVQQNTINDVSEVPFNNTVTIRVDTGGLIPDRTSPNLVAFNLYLNNGSLSLTFDDIVRSSPIDYQSFTLQDSLSQV